MFIHFLVIESHFDRNMWCTKCKVKTKTKIGTIVQTSDHASESYNKITSGCPTAQKILIYFSFAKISLKMLNSRGNPKEKRP